MNKLNVLIVDDEPMAQKVLEIYCQKIPNVNVVALCKNAMEAMFHLQNGKIDLLFMDINMPEITGVDFARALNGSANIIFTTAYSEYAVESYNLNAIDYLLKPISFERFVSALNKVFKLQITDASKTDASKDESILASENSIFVKSNGKRVRINLNDLLYIEGMKDYVKLCLSEEKIIVHGSLKRIEVFLQEHKQLVRVHKSYIVNTKKIKEFSNQQIKLVATNVIIPVGQTYFSDLEKAIEGEKY